MMEPIRLKKKCTKARLTAASLLNREAMIAVIVVPIFAPIMNFKALLILILPVAVSGTRSEVVTELDCISVVRRRPQPKDFMGELKMLSKLLLVLPINSRDNT